MFKKLLDAIEKKFGDERKKKSFRWFVLLFCVGVGLMLLSSFFGIEKRAMDAPALEAKTATTVKRSADHGTMIQQYEREYNSQLAEMLSQIAGVDDVTVMINLDSDEEEVFASDDHNTAQTTNEQDKNGGNRTITQNNTDKKIAHYRNEKGDLPIIIKKLKPKVRGVLVIARGVENLQVRMTIIEAIQRTLDVPIHRISVMPKG